jgi:hypothetical protein
MDVYRTHRNQSHRRTLSASSRINARRRLKRQRSWRPLRRHAPTGEPVEGELLTLLKTRTPATWKCLAPVELALALVLGAALS